MSDAGRINGDLRITGDLMVNGSMPEIDRTTLAQDSNAEYVIPLTQARVWDAMGSNLPNTSSADDLAIDGGTFGTDSPKITTGDVKASTVTRHARLLAELPPEYVDGQSVTVRVHAGMETTVADTSATVDVECYKSDKETGIGSDICTTAAQSINSLTFADMDFTITPSGLSSGDVLDIRITVAVTDAATATAVMASIGAIELLLDIKG